MTGLTKYIVCCQQLEIYKQFAIRFTDVVTIWTTPYYLQHTQIIGQ